MLRSLVTRNITAIRTPAAHSKLHTGLQPSRSLFTQSSFFTSHSTKKVTASILKREWRTYIRPHYYQNRQSLSEARRQQQNPFGRLVRNINNQSPEKLSWTIIGVNLAVFVTWQYAEGSYRQFGDGSWIVFMRDNFMTSLQNIREGRIYTLLTSSVSHSNMPHFLVNMVVLQSIAAPLIATLNPSRFLLFYAGSAVVSSLASLGYVKFVRPHLHKTYRFNSAEPVSSLGASGVLMAAMTFYGLAFPQTRFLLFFVIPMPALSVIGAVALYDLYNAYTQRVGIVDSAAHLGGVAYGAGYWFLRVRPLLRAGRWRL